MFKVLFSVANARPRPWQPLIDGFVDDNAVLQVNSADGDEALHWKPFCSVLLAYGHNVYQAIVAYADHQPVCGKTSVKKTT